MKKLLKNPLLMALAAVLMVLVPVIPAFAAPEWTCTSVVVASVNQTTKLVTVNLSYSNSAAEKVDILWGDTPVTPQVLHAVNSSSYPTTATHTYANYGSYAILMRVWGTGVDVNNHHDCGTQVRVDPTYCTNQGAGFLLSLTPLNHTTGTNYVMTATVSYDVVNATDYGKIDWSQGLPQALSAGDKTNFPVQHTYTGTGPFTVTLNIYNNSNVYQSKCTVLTQGQPSAVTISTITAGSVDDGFGWGTLALGGLGLVALGGVVLFAARKR